MKIAWVAWAIVAIALTASGVKADFLVQGFGYPGPLDDVYEFYALNDGAEGTGTQVAATNVGLLNAIVNGPYAVGNGLVFKFVDNTGGAPADTTGVALYHANGDNASVVFRGHSDRTFVNILGDESAADPTSYHPAVTNPDPELHSNYNIPVYMFEQTGAVPGGVDATSASNSGRGALVGVAVVQHGDPVVAFGTISGLSGPATTFEVIAPEPSSALLCAAPLGAMILRRRRAAL